MDKGINECDTMRSVAGGEMSHEEKNTMRVLQQSLACRKMPSEQQLSDAIQDFTLHHSVEWQCVLFMSETDPQHGNNMAVRYLYSLDDESARILAQAWTSVFDRVRRVMDGMVPSLPSGVELPSAVAEAEPEYGRTLSSVQSPEESELVMALMPMCYNNVVWAREYADQLAQCTESRFVAQVTQELLDAKKINPRIVKRPLFLLLQKFGLYTRSESTWTRSVTVHKYR